MIDMPRIVHKQKGPFGETVYTDENYRVIGTSHKGLFGEEVFLDKDFRYAGTKRKGILGEDVFLDKDFRVTGYGRKGLGGKVYLDKDGRYAGWSGKGLGEHETVFLDDAGGKRVEGIDEVKKYTAGAWTFVGVVFAVIILVLYLLMR